MRRVENEERTVPVTMSVKNRLLKFVDGECENYNLNRSMYINMVLEYIYQQREGDSSERDREKIDE